MYLSVYSLTLFFHVMQNDNYSILRKFFFKLILNTKNIFSFSESFQYYRLNVVILGGTISAYHSEGPGFESSLGRGCVSALFFKSHNFWREYAYFCDVIIIISCLQFLYAFFFFLLVKNISGAVRISSDNFHCCVWFVFFLYL